MWQAITTTFHEAGIFQIVMSAVLALIFGGFISFLYGLVVCKEFSKLYRPHHLLVVVTIPVTLICLMWTVLAGAQKAEHVTLRLDPETHTPVGGVLTLLRKEGKGSTVRVKRVVNASGERVRSLKLGFSGTESWRADGLAGWHRDWDAQHMELYADATLELLMSHEQVVATHPELKGYEVRLGNDSYTLERQDGHKVHLRAEDVLSAEQLARLTPPGCLFDSRATRSMSSADPLQQTKLIKVRRVMLAQAAPGCPSLPLGPGAQLFVHDDRAFGAPILRQLSRYDGATLRWKSTLQALGGQDTSEHVALLGAAQLPTHMLVVLDDRSHVTLVALDALNGHVKQRWHW